jgi:hypothetical protein
MPYLSNYQMRTKFGSPKTSIYGFAVQVCKVWLCKLNQHFIPGHDSNSLKVLHVQFFPKEALESRRNLATRRSRSEVVLLNCYASIYLRHPLYA